jgi:tRNA pseudouridine55 synthase
MNGILIIDKPQGVTSFDMVRQARRWCQTRRVGHAGTLDPLATGVLPIAVGWSTRLVEYMMAGEKIYQATMKLGVATDTQDSEGQVLEEKDWQHVNRQALDEALVGFIGQIDQLPPMYSALKKDGQPLYKLARQGIEVERQLRSITIESLVIDDFAPPFVTFTVRCSKGTYVRTLCHDLGIALNCGAHMTALRRLACGQFDVTVSRTPDEIQELVEQGKPLPLLSPADALADWPALTVTGQLLDRLQDGVAPSMADLDVSNLSAGDRVRFLNDGALVAVANFAPGGHGKRPGDFELTKVFPPPIIDA